MKTKIFLASSSELKEDREKFEILINRKNQQWHDRGVFLDLEEWENFLDALSKSRLQDEYNKAIKECDIFVMLFWTRSANTLKKNSRPPLVISRPPISL